MKPHPTSLVSAVLLYVLLAVVGSVAAMIIPWLIELGREHPRLAALVWLAVVMSPVYTLAVGHHVVSGVLDKRIGGILPAKAAWWAGVYGWMVTVMSTVVAAFIMTIIFPPERDEALFQSLVQMTPHSATVTLHTAIWILVATGLYQLERVARQSNAS